MASSGSFGNPRNVGPPKKERTDLVFTAFPNAKNCQNKGINEEDPKRDPWRKISKWILDIGRGHNQNVKKRKE
jgi:hypothetical protein